MNVMFYHWCLIVHKVMMHQPKAQVPLRDILVCHIILRKRHKFYCITSLVAFCIISSRISPHLCNCAELLAQQPEPCMTSCDLRKVRNNFYFLHSKVCNVHISWLVRCRDQNCKRRQFTYIFGYFVWHSILLFCVSCVWELWYHDR